MVKLDEIMDTHLLSDMLAEGYVRRGDHPTLPLHIYNYTAKAQFDEEWNEVTTQCRGLVVNAAGEVIARPFRKFFNLSQIHADDVPVETFSVYEKLDGSLGILYPTNDEHFAIATRGSFASEQAMKATAIYKARYKDDFEPVPGLTYLFEIVYPENRIVVDYGDREDIILIDVIDIETGESVLEGEHGWPGEVVRPVHVDSIEDLLAAPQEKNAEGFVLRFDNGMRVKVKHDEYVRLHRVLTNITARRLFEITARDDLLKKGFSAKKIAHTLGVDPDSLASIPLFVDILDRVPDEFYHWVKMVGDRLEREFRDLAIDVQRDYDAALQLARAETLATDDLRAFKKNFAAHVEGSKYSDILYRLLSEQDVSDMIWRRIRPAHEKPFFQQSEDVA